MRHKYFILIPLIYETLKYVNKKLHMKLSQVHDLQHHLENFINLKNVLCNKICH